MSERNDLSERNDMSEQNNGENPSSVIGINHVGMSVSNLDASLAFYTGAIETAPEQPLRAGNREAEIASGFQNDAEARTVLAFPNGYLQLSQYAESVSGPAEVIPVKGPGVTHVCYQSPTAENIYGSFLDHGAKAVSRGTEPVHLMGQGVYYAYARDHDGIMYETEHLDRSPFEGPIWLSHVALVSHDLDRLVGFYEMLFGQAVNRRSNKAAGPTFDEVADYDEVHIRAAWFDLGNMIVEMWQFVNPVTPEPGSPAAIESIGYNKVAYEVSNIDEEYERLKSFGVDFLSEPVTSPESTEVYFRDPDGNLISLVQPAQGAAISISNLKQKTW